VALDEGLGAHRLLRGDVVLHDRAQDRQLAFLDHGSSSPSTVTLVLALRVPECQAYPPRITTCLLL
jgi:hypothetical protein